MSTRTRTEEREDLIERLKDKRRRHHLVSVAIKRGLAEQIREMRGNREWTQSELARASGKVQETISQLEDPDYGSYTLKTLQRLAEAFDVALIVRFAPFSELADWMTGLSPEDLAVPDFEHDPGLVRGTNHVDNAVTAKTTPPIKEELIGRDLPLLRSPTSTTSMSHSALPTSYAIEYFDLAAD